MTNAADKSIALDLGLYWDDFEVGVRFRTRKRTLTETDLVNFVNLSWLTEELFANADPADRAAMGISARVVPGALVYAVAEGLVAPSFQSAGMAFLDATISMHKPASVGDTLHVECEVIERRRTRHADRGLVRTRNVVVNQREEAVMTYTPLRMMRLKGG